MVVHLILICSSSSSSACIWSPARPIVTPLITSLQLTTVIYWWRYQLSSGQTPPFWALSRGKQARNPLPQCPQSHSNILSLTLFSSSFSGLKQTSGLTERVTCDEMIDLSYVCWQSSSPEENLKVTDNFSSGPMTKHFHSFSELLEWFSKSIETEESNARTPVRRLMTWLDTNKYCQVSHSDHRNLGRKLTVIIFNKPWSWGGVLPKQLEKYNGKN